MKARKEHRINPVERQLDRHNRPSEKELEKMRQEAAAWLESQKRSWLADLI